MFLVYIVYITLIFVLSLSNYMSDLTIVSTFPMDYKFGLASDGVLTHPINAPVVFKIVRHIHDIVLIFLCHETLEV